MCTQKAQKYSKFSIFRFLQFRVFGKKNSAFSRIIFFTFFHFSKKNSPICFKFFFLIIFFNFLFLFCIKSHISKSQNIYLFYICIYYYFNMQNYPLFQLKNTKNRFFCAFCVHTQKILWDNSLMLCCSPKHFSWCLDTFWVSKNFTKKNIFRKKGYTAGISKKKKKKIEKSKNLADRPESAKYFLGIKTYVLGGYFV